MNIKSKLLLIIVTEECNIIMQQEC